MPQNHLQYSTQHAFWLFEKKNSIPCSDPRHEYSAYTRQNLGARPGHVRDTETKRTPLNSKENDTVWFTTSHYHLKKKIEIRNEDYKKNSRYHAIFTTAWRRIQRQNVENLKLTHFY